MAVFTLFGSQARRAKRRERPWQLGAQGSGLKAWAHPFRGSGQTRPCAVVVVRATKPTAKRQAAVRLRWIWGGRHSTRASLIEGTPWPHPISEKDHRSLFATGPCCVSSGRGGGVVWRHSRFTSSPFRVLLLLMLRPWHTFLMIPTHVLTLMRTLSRT